MKFGVWQTDLPHEPGDWLWILQWDCGCCLIRDGIFWVVETEMAPEGPDNFNYEVISLP